MAGQNKNPAPFIILGLVILGVFSLIVPQECGGTGSSDYVLPLGEDFNPAQALKDDLGISVVVAVDVSGSMASAPESGGDPKYIQASRALGEVTDVLGRILKNSPKDQVLKVALLKFSSEVEEVMPLTEMKTKSMERLKSLVSSPKTWRPDGATAIGDAVAEGVRILASSGTILRSLIVVTDGENTEGTEPADVMSAVFKSRNDKSTPDFPVNTGSYLVSFIGFDIGSGYFEPFGQYGARVTSASDEAELAQRLSALLEADITKLEAPDLGARHGQ